MPCRAGSLGPQRWHTNRLIRQTRNHKSKDKQLKLNDGHTLNEQLEQAAILMQAEGMKLETAYVETSLRTLKQTTR
jgi:glucan phosphorylase